MIGFSVLCLAAVAVPVLGRAQGPGAGDPRNDLNGNGVLDAGDQQALAQGIVADDQFPPNPCVERRQYQDGDTLINPWDGSVMTPNASSYYVRIPESHPWLPALRAGTPVAWRYC
jgi:hypothetical protein